MSKFDKKVISFLVIMCMMLTNIMPVISKAATGESVIKDPILEEGLYDENEDGIISKEEVADMEYIIIPAGVKDLSGLEYATRAYGVAYDYDGSKLDLSPIPKDDIYYFEVFVQDEVTTVDFDFLKKFTNVKFLRIAATDTLKLDLTGLIGYENIDTICLDNIEISDLNVLSKLTNLRDLSIDNREKVTIDLNGIEKLTKLEYLYMNNQKIKNANAIGKLANLSQINLYDCTGIGTADFLADNTKLNYVDVCKSDISDISFVENLKELEIIWLEGTEVTDLSPLTKVINLSYVSPPAGTDIKEISGIIKYADYKAYIGEKIYLYPTIRGITSPFDWNFASSDESVVAVDQETSKLEAVALGEATITAVHKDDASIVKTLKITVNGIDSNQPVGNKIDAKQLRENYILKENGELWKIQAKEAKSEKVDTDVKKYVYEFVYNNKNEAFNYTLTQKTDGTVKYSFNGVETELKDVKDIYANGYLSNDGTYYTITENGTWKKVTDNVEKLVGSYLVKNDGKTYTVTNKLVCDFKIIDAKYYLVVDENKVIWRVGSGFELTKWGENFEEFLTAEYQIKYKATDGNIYNGTEQTNYLFEASAGNGNILKIDMEHNLILNETVILTKVTLALGEENDNNGFILLREDGSVWTLWLNGDAKLEKVEEQKESVFFANDTVKTKPIALSTINEAITGFDIKKLDVASVMNNFKSTYSVKIYKDDKELTGTAKVSTGSLIQLYNEDGELVKEYTALIYGDVTGSGNPSAKDALAIIKNKTGKLTIENKLYLEAARVTENTRKTAGVPNASDALAIVKSKLGKYTISM